MVEGATATFMGTSEFSDNSVAIRQIGPVSYGPGCTTIGRGLSYVTKKGGAVHNKVLLCVGRSRGTRLSGKEAKKVSRNSHKRQDATAIVFHQEMLIPSPHHV